MPGRISGTSCASVSPTSFATAAVLASFGRPYWSSALGRAGAFGFFATFSVDAEKMPYGHQPPRFDASTGSMPSKRVARRAAARTVVSGSRITRRSERAATARGSTSRAVSIAVLRSAGTALSSSRARSAASSVAT